MSNANPAGVILAYHRIDNPSFDRWQLSVSPQNFAEHLDVLSRVGVPISLSDMAYGVRDKALPDGAVAITFDDGYTNNLTEAKDLLESYEVPAMVFLCSGLLGSPSEFWWDELEYAFFSGETLPRELTLVLDGVAYHWDNDTGEGSCRADGLPPERVELHDKVWDVVRSSSPAARHGAISQIRAWTGRVSQRPGYRPMSDEEVDKLLQGSLVTIGSHTVSHCFLTSAGPDMQRFEIATDLRKLEARFGGEISAVAFPHGAFDGHTIDVLKSEPIHCACTTRTGLVTHDNSLLTLPRICPGDWSGDRLMSELRSFGWPAQSV